MLLHAFSIFKRVNQSIALQGFADAQKQQALVEFLFFAFKVREGKAKGREKNSKATVNGIRDGKSSPMGPIKPSGYPKFFSPFTPAFTIESFAFRHESEILEEQSVHAETPRSFLARHTIFS